MFEGFYKPSLSELVENKSKHRILHSYWPLNRGETIEERSSGRQKGGCGRLIEVAAKGVSFTVFNILTIVSGLQ